MGTPLVCLFARRCAREVVFEVGPDGFPLLFFGGGASYRCSVRRPADFFSRGPTYALRLHIFLSCGVLASIRSSSAQNFSSRIQFFRGGGSDAPGSSFSVRRRRY